MKKLGITVAVAARVLVLFGCGSSDPTVTIPTLEITGAPAGLTDDSGARGLPASSGSPPHAMLDYGYAPWYLEDTYTQAYAQISDINETIADINTTLATHDPDELAAITGVWQTLASG